MLQLKRQVLLYGEICAAILVAAMSVMLVASTVSRPAPAPSKDAPSLVILNGDEGELDLLVEEEDALCRA